MATNYVSYCQTVWMSYESDRLVSIIMKRFPTDILSCD